MSCYNYIYLYHAICSWFTVILENFRGYIFPGVLLGCILRSLYSNYLNIFKLHLNLYVNVNSGDVWSYIPNSQHETFISFFFFYVNFILSNFTFIVLNLSDLCKFADIFLVGCKKGFHSKLVCILLDEIRFAFVTHKIHKFLDSKIHVSLINILPLFRSFHPSLICISNCIIKHL